MRYPARAVLRSRVIIDMALASLWLYPSVCLVAGCAAVATSPGSEPQWRGPDAALPPNSTADAQVDASSCVPGNLSTFVPSVYHPAVAPQDACRPVGLVHDPISLFYDDCFGPHASKEACADLAQTPALAACTRCIETPLGADSYGPLVVDKGALVAANVAGCIELTQPHALSCAKAVQAQAECEMAACEANCYVSDPVSLGQYQACASQARDVGCQAFATASVCGDAGQVDACSWPSFKDFYDHVVPLFCASPPPIADMDAAAASDAVVVDSGSPLDAAPDASHDAADARAE